MIRLEISDRLTKANNIWGSQNLLLVMSLLRIAALVIVVVSVIRSLMSRKWVTTLANFDSIIIVSTYV
jgi:hypothetical protein